MAGWIERGLDREGGACVCVARYRGSREGRRSREWEGRWRGRGLFGEAGSREQGWVVGELGDWIWVLPRRARWRCFLLRTDGDFGMLAFNTCAFVGSLASLLSDNSEVA